jgi:hypothetical protein
MLYYPLMKPSNSAQSSDAKQVSFVFLSKAICCVFLAAAQAIAGAQTPVSLLTPLIQPGTLGQQSPPEPGLHIQILEGDRGVNIIKRKTAVAPVVEVRDRNNLPVAGAVVTFTAPNDGPSIVFLNGSRSITVVSEADGRATTVGLKPLNEGSFQISVSATSDSQTAAASFQMTNVLTPAAAAGVAGAGTVATASATSGGLSAGMIGLIVGVGAAAAVGLAVGLMHHGSSSSSTATIGVGTGTVGAPH